MKVRIMNLTNETISTIEMESLNVDYIRDVSGETLLVETIVCCLPALSSDPLYEIYVTDIGKDNFKYDHYHWRYLS